ncbi:DNA cytosine methyltransferase [Pseudoalteromonas luteoviolacea]|uniref:DNA cytosine methyltransferase n=1 Tax=Pseudoalteromonas luteoviolacea TaxID=43657 RepID=UPI001B39D551|nr:DNA cytosine methyltransferase [Pseudoalteromonas luteoviolacea]MBQ4878419.1 DNA cytosine methyltransferase [Pseudoalteromonas luteoviolacea]MBQ4907574.1 DNA cytosine methyltransferase [Pseudoalteromonas luteoviolacea]
MLKPNQANDSANSRSPIIFSFFAGSGFLDLGFERTGFDVRFVNEFHKPFYEAYKYSRQIMNHPEPQYEHHLGSIEEFLNGNPKKRLKQYITNAKKDNLVGFIGGPPCPDFSVAGKNKGREGDHGKLTESYIDTIIAFKPDFFLLENVKGLWSNKKHFLFYKEMKDKLENAGYILTDRLANCIEFGAPQDRDRILLFGIKRSKVKRNQRLKLDQNFKWNTYLKFDKEVVLNKSLWPTTTLYSANSSLPAPDFSEDIEELTVEYWFRKNDVCNHPNAKHHFKPKAGLPKMQTIAEGDVSGKSFKRLHRWRYSATAAYGNNEVHLHPYQDRRLSAAEALAIQSLPKEFVLPKDMGLSNMFKTIGNGVPFLLSEAIAKTIKDFLKTL